MVQKNSRELILTEFFDFPRKDFQMRELSRRTGVAQPSVINHLDILVGEGLILKERKSIYPSFRANRENINFKLLKRQKLIWRMRTLGLLDYLETEYTPNCIILFGSGSRGEDTEESDLDIFIQAEENELNLQKYEKKLNRKISLLFEPKIDALSKELLNNLINGQVLSGYLKVF